MYFIFPPHLTSASALPGETRNPEIASFHLYATCLFTKKHKTVKNITWSELNHPSPSKRSTGCTRHQTGPRKGAQHSAVCYPHALCQPSLSRCQSLCKRWQLFFVKPGVKVNGQWDILLCQQLLDAIKHITDDHFVFEEDSAQVHCACNTVQLSENVIFVFPRFARQCRSTSYLRWHSKASFDCLLYR